MKKAVWLLLPLMICFVGVASAEFYKYTDENGVTRFTDDLSKVPQDQRTGVQSYDEAESRPAPASESDTKPSDSSPGKTTRNSINDAQARALDKKSVELDQEYQKIIEDRDQLEKQRKNAKTVKESRDYNKKIVDLNERIRQWEEKRDALNAEFEAYNAKVSQAQKKEVDK